MTLPLLSLLLLAPGESLQPDPLKTFDGRQWSGIELNYDTDERIKRRFRTEKGAVVPEALKIVTDRPRDVRVDALLDGRGGKAVVRSVRVEYAYGGPTVDEMETAWQETAEPRYQRDRNEEWHLAIFRAAGAVAVVHRDRATVWFLTGREGVDRAVRGYSETPTRIVPVRDPGEDWDRTVRFGSVRASVSLGNNQPDDVRGDWAGRVEDRLKDDLRDARGRALRFDRGGDGAITVNLSSGRFDDDGKTNFSCSMSLATTTPYGRLERYVSRSRDVSSRYRERVADLAYETFQELQDDVARTVRKLGPPPVEYAREQAVLRLCADVTGR